MTIVRNIFSVWVLLWCVQAFAHAPYERPAGSFTRLDGTLVSVVEHFEDGILSTDPVTIQFHLPDGSTFSQIGPFTTDVVVRNTQSAAEIYLYESRWVPIAASVKRFDGYALTDITARKQTISPFLHTLHYWRAYLIGLISIAILSLSWVGLQSMPRTAGLKIVRMFGLICTASIAAILGLLLLFFSPNSPLVLLFLAVVCAFIYFLSRRVYRITYAA